MQEVIKVGKDLEKIHQTKLQNCEHDFELEKTLKKNENYCNKLIKNPIREKEGKNITSASSTKDIWKSINDIHRPDTVV